MIDRAVNAVYFVTVAGGAVPGTFNPFVENLTDTNDELMSVFEVFTVSNKWNVVYTAGGANTITTGNLDQQDHIDRDLSTMMKDCTFYTHECSLQLFQHG